MQSTAAAERKRLHLDVSSSSSSQDDSAISINDSSTGTPSSSQFSDECLSKSPPPPRTGKVPKKRTRKVKKSPKQYVCNVCEKRFLGVSDLRKHQLIHTDERPFTCEFCSKKFRQAICLKNHIAAIHGTDIEYTCEFCLKKFPIKERLRLHLRIHLGHKPYSCPACPKTFARGGQLKQHLITHSAGNKFRCNQCTASFATEGNLRKHTKIHLDQTEYMCHICTKGFFRADDLRHHLKTVHTGSKTFNCKICKKTLKGHFYQHLKVHGNIRPHICETCGAQFCQKSQLNVHQRTHSGERPYRCQVCWRAFAHSSVLKLHIRKHTGEKPFKCLLCKEGIAFSQLAHLKTHMRTIHMKNKPYMCEGDGCQQFYKTKAELDAHCQHCQRLPSNRTENQNAIEIETKKLSKLRLLIVVLLKKISTEEKLKKLGFEKRLIDNIIVDALKMAGRTPVEDGDLTELERLKMNIKEFLEWTIPETFMQTLKDKSVEEILEDLAWAYSKEKE